MEPLDWSGIEMPRAKSREPFFRFGEVDGEGWELHFLEEFHAVTVSRFGFAEARVDATPLSGPDKDTTGVMILAPGKEVAGVFKRHLPVMGKTVTIKRVDGQLTVLELIRPPRPARSPSR